MNLPFLTASVSAEMCCTTIMMMLLVMDMARAMSQLYYDYWETGNEQAIDQMAEKTLWLGAVLAAAGMWAYYMDELNQMGMGGIGGESGSNFKGQLYNGIRNPDVDFVNSKGKSTLYEHAINHGYTSPEEYLDMIQ